MRRDPREIWGDEPEERDAAEAIEELSGNARVQQSWVDRPAMVPLRVVGRFIRKSGKRIAITIAGFTVLLAGIAMLALPGPGWAAIFLGLAILSTEYVWAQRLLKLAKRKFGEAKDAVLGKKKPYEVIDHEGTVVRGFETISAARHEVDLDGSRIDALWAAFRRLHAETWPAFAVYDSYESDHTGSYRVVVGTPGLEADAEAKVEAGRFARFVAEGEQPTALIETWRRISAATESGELERAFTADLEIHHPDRVEILIALR